MYIFIYMIFAYTTIPEIWNLPTFEARPAQLVTLLWLCRWPSPGRRKSNLGKPCHLRVNIIETCQSFSRSKWFFFKPLTWYHLPKYNRCLPRQNLEAVPDMPQCLSGTSQSRPIKRKQSETVKLSNTSTNLAILSKLSQTLLRAFQPPPSLFAGTFLGPKNTNNFRENTSGTHEPSDTSSTRNLPVPPEPSGTLFAAPELFFLRRRKNAHQHFVLSYFAVKTQSLWKIERWKGPSESETSRLQTSPKGTASKSSKLLPTEPTTNCFPGFPRFFLHGLELIHCLQWWPVTFERWSLSPPKNLSNRWLSRLYESWKWDINSLHKWQKWSDIIHFMYAMCKHRVLRE